MAYIRAVNNTAEGFNINDVTINLEGSEYIYDYNEYGFVNASGDAYMRVYENGIRFVFGGEGDAITIPDGAADTIELYYIDKSNGGAETKIANPPTVASEYTVTMTTGTTRRSGDAEFTVSGIDADADVRAGSNITFLYRDAGGTLTFDRTGALTGINAASGEVDMYSETGDLLIDFKIDGASVNITAVTDEDNYNNLVYNKSENSLFGLADGSVIVNAGGITKIYAPDTEGAFTFGGQVYTSASEGDHEDNERAYFTVDGTKVTGFTFAALDDMITATDFSGWTFTDASTGNTFDAPVVTEGEDAARATVNDNGVACYSTFGTNLEGKTVTFGDGTKVTFNDAETDTELFFDTAGKLSGIINLDTTGNEVVISDATGSVFIDERELEIIGGGFTYRMYYGTPAIIDVKAGATILKAAGVNQIRTIAGTAGNGIYTFGNAAYEVTGNVDGVIFNLDGNLNVTGISGINGTESVKLCSDKLTLTNAYSSKITLGATVIEADASARTLAADITGNALNNSMVGGSGNDTLRGAGGNDTISGGAGSDLFVYNAGEGNDVITDFGATDTLKIGYGYDTYSKETVGSDIVVTVGEGSVTLRGAASLSNPHILGTEINYRNIVGTQGNDTIVNSLDGATIQALGGNDSVQNSGSNVTIAGGTGDDSIRNVYSTGYYDSQAGGSFVSINGGEGADYIYNHEGNSVSINSGEGADYIYNHKGDNATVNAGAGNDTINNSGTNVTISSGEGNDRISLGSAANNNLIIYTAGNDSITGFNATSTLKIGDGNGSYATVTNYNDIIVLVGNETITLDDAASLNKLNIVGKQGKVPNIIGTDGDDSIENTFDRMKISLGAGDDTIDNIGFEVTIDAGAGNDTITSGGYAAIIDGGAGDDYICHYYDDNISIDGGAGNDSIQSETGINGSITGGAGDDLISNEYSEGMVYVYNAGDGNDTILGFNETSTLLIPDTSWSTQVSGDGKDIIVTVGDGRITLKDAASLDTVNITSSAADIHPINVIENTQSNTIITGTSYRDSVYNRYSNVTINAGAGDDTIDNSGFEVTIDAGAGSDYINNGRASVSIDGGAGNDYISNWENNVTINGGAGDDLIRLRDSAYDNLIICAAGEGNDTIVGFNENSTLSISGDAYLKENVGSDVIITAGDGSITLQGAATLSTLNIVGEEIIGIDLTNGDAAKITLDAAVTKANATARTKATRIVGNALDNSILGGSGKDTLYGKDGNDYIAGSKGNDKLLGQNGNDTLLGGGGNDTLTGGAGSDLFVYNAGDGNDVITDFGATDTLKISDGSAEYSKDTVDGNVIVTVGDGSITLQGAASLSKLNILGTEENSTGVEIDGKTARLTDDFTDNGYSIADNLDVTTIDASVITYDIELIGNKKANSILGGDGNDTIIGGKGNDNLTGGKGSDVFVYNSGDGNDLITDYAEEDKLRINGAISKITTTKGGTVIFTVDGGKVSVKGGANKVIAYEDANAKQYFYPVTFNAAGTAATLLANYTKDTFDVANYGDYAGTLKTITASAITHDLTITGNKLANKILGGTGNDTLIGGKGNDSLNGGKGSDVFVYNSGDGNDTIAGYAEEDKLQINGTVSKKATSGKNVILTVGDYKITLKDAAGKVITYTDNTAEFSADGTSVTLTNKYTADAFDVANYPDYAGNVKTINGAAVTHNVSITANSKANTIYGSANNDYLDGGAAKDVLYGGEGNDTLIGGTGNDTLWGGDGSDVFLYNEGDGNDVISDYAKGEKISVTGAAVDKATVSGDNVVLTIGAGKITVKDAAKNNTPVTYYVDGKKKTYKPTASDLLIDDNYSADAAQLTNIVEPVKADYTPYDFQQLGTRNQELGTSFFPCSLSLVPNCFFSKA